MKKATFFILLLLSTTLSFGQLVESSGNNTNELLKEKKTKKKKKKRKKYKLPDIDLNNWKVTIPIGDPKVIEVSPPEILDYATNETLKPYMYNDSTRGAIVFHAYPSKTTRNTKYSRSELREQMVSGENNVNWTFEQGGNMKVKMAMDAVSRAENGKYHKVIIAQIHGRLTNEQRDRIGQKDNNAPPILKVYWQDGKIRVKTKVLKSQNVIDDAILLDEAWDDDKGYTFKQKVGFGKFTLEVDVEDGKMVVSLNNQEFAVYDSTSIKRWNIFENYFKVGNYLQTRDEGAFAKVRVYKLDVSH
ncbi:alginate lyase [Dokdonia sp. MED134]|nr:alginate lyase [Dokdonia sp. MED134]